MAGSNTIHEDSKDDRTPSDPLSGLERAFAYGVGIVAGGAGGYAVFERSNQLGSAVLLVIGAVFILIGVQGTRVISFTTGSNTVEWDRRRKVEKAIVEAQNEGNLEKASGIAEGAVIAAPYLRPDVNPLEYEIEVGAAVAELGYAVLRWGGGGGGRHTFDMAVRDDSHRVIYLEIKYWLRPLNRNAVLQALGLASSADAPVLLVTYTELSPSAEQAVAAAKSKIEVVQWRGQGDTPQLAETLSRMFAGIPQKAK